MTTRHATTSIPLADLLADWTRRGLVSAEQAEALRDDRQVLVPSRTRTNARAIALEALGYLGAGITAAAAITVTAQNWSDLSGTARSALLGATALALLLAGRGVPVAEGATGATARVRSALLFTSVAAAASFLAVLGDALLDLRGADLGLWVGLGSAAYAGAVHWWWRAPLQQAAQMIALGGAAAAVVAWTTVSDSLPGIGWWVVGGAWALLAWTERTRPHWLGLVGGTAMSVLGAMFTAGSDPGMVFLIVTLAAIVTAGLATREPAVLAVGAVGVVINVPAAVDRWFPGSLAAPFALMAVGLAVVGLAVLAAHRGRDPHGDGRRRPTVS